MIEMKNIQIGSVKIMTKTLISMPSLEWLSDLNVFAVNRPPAHSDHVYYETVEEAKNGVPMPLRYELNEN